MGQEVVSLLGLAAIQMKWFRQRVVDCNQGRVKVRSNPIYRVGRELKFSVVLRLAEPDEAKPKGFAYSKENR